MFFELPHMFSPTLLVVTLNPTATYFSSTQQGP